MKPFELMLPKELNSFEDVFSNWELVVVEPKIDGIRIQAHLENGTCRLFTRTGREITFQFPYLCEDILGATYSRNTILDGELIAVNNNQILSFEEIMRRYKSKQQFKDIGALFFDLIDFEENNIFDKPYVERKQLLIDILNPTKSVSVVPSRVVKNEIEAESLYRQILDKKFEGIVVKNGYGYYEFGRSDDILKLKPLNFIDLIVKETEAYPSGGFWYSLTDGRKEICNIRDWRRLAIGSWVEVGFEKQFSSGKLKFARIIREREAKKP